MLSLFPLCEVSKTVKLIEIESGMAVSRGWGGEGGGNLLFNGHRASVFHDKKVLESCGPTRRIYLTLSNSALENGEEDKFNVMNFLPQCFKKLLLV